MQFNFEDYRNFESSKDLCQFFLDCTKLQFLDYLGE